MLLTSWSDYGRDRFGWQPNPLHRVAGDAGAAMTMGER